MAKPLVHLTLHQILHEQFCLCSENNSCDLQEDEIDELGNQQIFGSIVALMPNEGVSFHIELSLFPLYM